MIKKILFFILFISLAGLAISQPITTTVISSSGHLDPTDPRYCHAGSPVMAAEFLPGSTGSHVAGGQLFIDDLCGTTKIKFTITNVKWSQNDNVNWIHGLYFPSNAGVSNLVPIGLPNNWGPYGPQTAALCAHPGSPGPQTGPAGFYYNGLGSSCCNPSIGDGNPSNNYGDNQANCNEYAFSFNVDLCNDKVTPATEFTIGAVSDYVTGCWTQIDNAGLSEVKFKMSSVIPTIPLYQSGVANTTAIQKDCTAPTTQYTAILESVCGNGTTVSWWTALTGGTLLGTGSPFAYNSANDPRYGVSQCPTGLTVYAQCCPIGNVCGTRRAYAIGNRAGDPTCNALTITNVVKVNGNCSTPNSITSITTINGTAPITYTLTPGPISNTTGVFPGLALNSYTLTATDAGGCVSAPVAVNFTPTSVPSWIPTATTVGASCPGVNNGSISVTTTPSASYTYTLDGNAGTAITTIGTATFNNVSGGNHIITVNDGTCSKTLNVTVTNGAGPAINTSFTNTSCNNATNGTMTAVPTGTNGTAPFTYTISPGTNTTGATSGIFTGLAPGTYTITITDANNCTGTGTPRTIVAGAVLNGTATTTGASCPTASDGTATVTGTTGTGIHTYTINSSPVQTNTTGVFTGLPGALYTINFTDANGCTGSVGANVTPGTPVTSTAVLTPTSCNGSADGAITVTPSATGSYSYTINTTPPQTNTTGIFTGLAGGTYNITYTNTATGCGGTRMDLILLGPALTSTTSSTAASCPGVSNGTATVTPAGGTAPYSFILTSLPANTTGASTGIFTGLAGGATYNISFTSANGCTGTASVAVSAGTPITATATATNTSCNNAANGTVTVSPANAGTYVLNTTPTVTNTTGVFNNLPAGTYTVTYTNSNNCSATTTPVTITAGTALTATANTTAASCPGINNGSVTITAPSGTAPFTYTINTAPPVTNNIGIFGGLAGGSYTVAISDASGCNTGTTPIAAVVGAGTPISVNGAATPTTCNNANNGTITATPANAGTYTINTTPVQTNTTGIFNNLPFGTYIITLADANGCSATSAPIQVVRGGVLNATITNTGAACTSINNGTVTVVPTTGTAPFSFTINTTPANTTGASSGIFTGLPGGVYNVTFTDANTCTGQATTTVATGAGVSATATGSTTSTSNAADGTATATATGGTTPYAYTINATPANTTGASSGIFTGLVAGTYTITITDANGCTATTPVTVTPGPGLTGTVTSTNSSCPAISDGSATITAPTGVGPWTYSINATPANTTGATTGIFTGLAAGTYLITIIDANGSTGGVPITVNANAALIGTAAVTNTSCNTSADGAINTTPANAGSYSINTMPPVTNTTGIFTGLAAGNYVITYTNAAGCVATIPANIVPGPALTSTSTTVNASCPAISDGSLTVTPTAGTAPYSFTINTTPPATNTTGTFTGLAAGTYAVSFSSANTCTGNATGIVVSANPALTATATAVNTSCNLATDGTITTSPASTGSYTLNSIPAVTNTTGIFSGIAPGTYHVTFTNAAGCTAVTPDVTVAAGLALTSTSSTTNASCPGVSDGSLTVTPTTGTGPFTFTINAVPANTTGAATGIFTGLPVGIYTVSFVAANGCTGTLPNIQVAADAALSATATATATSCNNATDGTVTTTPANLGSYTINTTPAVTNTTGVFTGLAAGTYQVTYTNAANCVATVTNIVVSAGAALVGTSTTVNSSCPVVNDGSLTLTPTTGTGPFSFTINTTPPVTNTTGIFGGLAAGTYDVTFTAANTCNGSVTGIVVSANPALTATAAATATSCNNATDGTVTTTPANLGSYTINTTPAITNTTGVFTGLAAGTYQVTYTNAANCMATVTNIVVSAGAALVGTSATVNSSCPAVNDGSLTVTPTTGTGPFSFTINTTPPVTNTTGIFGGLAAGTYDVTFTAANTCNGSVTGIVVSANPALTATAAATATSCNNATDGTVTTTPANLGSYTINTTPPLTNTTGTFTGLAAGNYIVTFTNAANCVATTNQVTIAAGPQLTATPTTTATSCPGINNGTFTAGSPSGTGPFTFTIDAVPANTSGASSGTFSLLPAGVYNISFTDANGCTGTVQGTVAQGAALTSTATFANPNCAGINDGVFTVIPDAASGTAPYTYTIDAVPANTTGAANGSFTSLAAGTYTITFTDANGCTGTQTQTLTTNAPITTPETHTDPKCFAGTDGTITLTPAGGAGPFTYALLPSTTFQASNVITGLGAGSHTIRVKDNFGCIKDATIILTEPAQLFATAVKDNNTTCEGNDGGITVTATGGTTPYEYSIDNGVTYQATGGFTNATNTVYSGNIKVRDANGCSATANSVTVGQDNNLTLDIITMADTTVCQGSSIKFSPVTNAGAGATYVWTSTTPAVPNSTIDNVAILNATVTPADTVVYNLKVNYKACSITDNVKVNVLWKPIVNAGPNAVSVCLGDSTLLIGSVTHTSGPIDSMVWTPSDSLTTPHSIQTWAHPVKTTYYQLTAYTSVLNYGCLFTPQAYDSIKVVIPPTVVASAGRDTIAVLGQPHQLLGSGGVAYSWWSPTVSISSPFTQNPFVTLNSDANFFVEVKNSIGCADTAEVFVKVYNGPTYYIPNAFSPNGDGMNDIFRAIPVGISNTQYFKVMNRYGETVFETNQYLRGWDGTFKGKKQPLGVYVWIVKGQDKTGKIVEMKGTVMLIQ